MDTEKVSIFGFKEANFRVVSLEWNNKKVVGFFVEGRERWLFRGRRAIKSREEKYGN